MSVEDYDRFTDKIETHVGSLDGVGYSEFQSVVNEVTPEGVVFQFDCQGCGRPKNLLVEWGELIALDNSVDPAVLHRAAPRSMRDPASWGYKIADKAFYPKVICPDCSMKKQVPISLRIEGHEPRRYLRAGAQASYLPQDFYQQLDQMCKGLAQRGMRIR